MRCTLRSIIVTIVTGMIAGLFAVTPAPAATRNIITTAEIDRGILGVDIDPQPQGNGVTIYVLTLICAPIIGAAPGDQAQIIALMADAGKAQVKLDPNWKPGNPYQIVEITVRGKVKGMTQDQRAANAVLTGLGQFGLACGNHSFGFPRLP